VITLLIIGICSVGIVTVVLLSVARMAALEPMAYVEDLPSPKQIAVEKNLE
jgi:hypothetical protein